MIPVNDVICTRPRSEHVISCTKFLQDSYLLSIFAGDTRLIRWRDERRLETDRARRPRGLLCGRR